MGWEDVEHLLPDELHLQTITIGADSVTVTARPRAPTACCPACGQASGRVHRYSPRTLADLPCLGRRVTLRVRARHFYCTNALCPRRIFAERLGPTARGYARRTERLRTALLGLVYEAGGEAGARVARRLGMPVSPDTLLRLIHRAPLRERARLCIVGVDDWSWKRGQRFGTILIDLERHCPVDLLPQRSAASCAAWLRTHDTVTVIARDRGETYAQGATLGAPAACQVADRWHLLHNLTDAVEGVLQRHHVALQATTDALRQAALAAPVPDDPVPAAPPSEEPWYSKSAARQRASWARRQTRYEQVRALHAQGLSQRELARTLHLSRKTVRRYLHAGQCPRYAGGARRRSHSFPDRFEPYLRQRWDAGCQNAAALYRELRERGYAGTASRVRQYVRQWRPEGARPGKPAPGSRGRPAPPAVPNYSPRQATWLLLKAPAALTAAEQAYVEHLGRLCPEVQTVRALAHEFGRLVRHRDAAALSAWLEAAAQSGSAEVAGLAAGIAQERAPVDAALTLPWSSGQVEGQINRLKVLKRQGYGRAGVDLLRKRVLPLSALG